MKIMQSTGTYERYSLHLHLRGISMRVERPKVGGGWYSRHRIEMPWPRFHGGKDRA